MLIERFLRAHEHPELSHRQRTHTLVWLHLVEYQGRPGLTTPSLRQGLNHGPDSCKVISARHHVAIPDEVPAEVFRRAVTDQVNLIVNPNGHPRREHNVWARAHDAALYRCTIQLVVVEWLQLGFKRVRAVCVSAHGLVKPHGSNTKVHQPVTGSSTGETTLNQTRATPVEDTSSRAATSSTSLSLAAW